MPAIAKPGLLRQDGVTIVHFDPAVRAITEDVLLASTDTILSAAEADDPRIVVDLKGIEFFSSSFIELMFRLWKRVKNRDGRFALCNLHPYCREVLEITNLHTLWSLCDSRDDAIADVNGAADAP